MTMNVRTIVATSALILLSCSTEHDAIVDECVEVLDSYAALFSLSKGASPDELGVLEKRVMDLAPRTELLVSTIKENLDDMKDVDSRRIARPLSGYHAVPLLTNIGQPQYGLDEDQS